MQKTPRGITLDVSGNRNCAISILQPDLVRVRFIKNASPREPRTWMVPAHGANDVPWEGRDRSDDSSWPIQDFELNQIDGEIFLTTSALTLTIKSNPLSLAWSLPSGEIFAQDRPAHPYIFSNKTNNLTHALARHPADRYYGLGDKTGKLDLHGRRLRTTMIDSLGYNPETGDPLYKHWPFVITRDGATGTAWGLFYDSFSEATFDLGCEHDNYYGLYRSYEAAGELDYYVFPGPQVADVTSKFLELTGRPPIPPRWTLGFAQTAMAIADSANAQERMEEFIARCASEDIPVSAFHFGSGYTTIGPRRYVFTWNRDKYPDPAGLMRRFHDAGMHVVANLKPCLLDDHPRFAEATAGFIKNRHGGLAISQFWDGEGAHLDFTNPAAIAWWKAGVTHDVLATGIDIAWNDNNEYGFRDEDAVCHGFGQEIPLDLARSVHALLMTRASVDAQTEKNPENRPFSVTRAGCPGIQRYAQTWSGDNSTSWDSLKWNLRTGLQMGLSGMANIGHDIGGFSGPIPDAELLIRWTQMGVIHPRFIMNSWKPDGVYTTPWLHPESTPHIRAAIRLRYRLIPYLYSLLHDPLHPPLRPTFVTYGNDAATWDDNCEAMLGPSLLAAPVVTPGERARSTYLPAGPECWFDFWTGERLQAGETTCLAAPIDRLPLALPAGAILPLTNLTARRHDEPSRNILIYPGFGHGENIFTLVEDDGISANAAITEITITLNWTPLRVDVFFKGAQPYDVTLRKGDQRRVTIHEEGKR